MAVPRLPLAHFTQAAGMKNVMPFWIVIVDTTGDTNQSAPQIAAGQSYENTVTLSNPFWWTGINAVNISTGTGAIVASLQFFSSVENQSGDQVITNYQKIPIDLQNMACFLTQGVLLSLPFRGGILSQPFRKPRYLDTGTTLMCRVQNFPTSSSLQMQLVLCGYIPE